MEIKILDYKKHNQISLKSIFEKYDNSIPIKLNPDELKSILSVSFSINFHFPLVNEESQFKIDNLLLENNKLFNISRDFGRHVIENLEGSNKTWLNDLLKKSYQLDKVFNNQKILDFIEIALIDYMKIRNWEFGIYFIKEFSKMIVDRLELDWSSKRINTALENDRDYLTKICKKIQETKSNLETHEILILVFVLQDNTMKNKVSIHFYDLISRIVREKYFELNLKTDLLKNTFSKSLKLNWNNNKGMGGLRR